MRSTARKVLLTHVTPVLDRVGVTGPVFRLYERAISWRGGSEDVTPDDGLPLPPPRLRTVVAGGPSASTFLATGAAAARSLTEIFAETGLDLRDAPAVLDFGCGCGRVARHWHPIARPAWSGCDYNGELVAWCRDNLTFMRFERNGVEPPLAFASDSFDAGYAISVFTHLPEPLQHAWMAELLRVMKPGGRLLLTTHGDATVAYMQPEERARYEAGEMVVRFGDHPGSNLCSTYHPRAWVESTLLAGLEVLTFRPGPNPGLGDQDVYVVGR